MRTTLLASTDSLLLECKQRKMLHRLLCLCSALGIAVLAGCTGQSVLSDVSSVKELYASDSGVPAFVDAPSVGSTPRQLLADDGILAVTERGIRFRDDMIRCNETTAQEAVDSVGTADGGFHGGCGLTEWVYDQLGIKLIMLQSSETVHRVVVCLADTTARPDAQNLPKRPFPGSLLVKGIRVTSTTTHSDLRAHGLNVQRYQPYEPFRVSLGDTSVFFQPQNGTNEIIDISREHFE